MVTSPDARPQGDPDWHARLTPEQFHVMRRHGTERPGTSPLNHEHGAGLYLCAGCGHPLFRSTAKYDSGSGWPSFWEPLPGAVATSSDHTLAVPRTEVHCARCHGHLGHVFPDGPQPTGLRFCMNGVALRFDPQPEE